MGEQVYKYKIKKKKKKKRDGLVGVCGLCF